MNRLLSFAVATGTVALMSLIPVVSHAQVHLKFANVTSQSAKDAGVFFKEMVEKESKGTLIIDHFPDNQLGDDRTVVESTIFGDIDLVVSSTSPMANILADFYIFDAPFMYLSIEEAYAGLDGAAGQAILKDMEKNGLMGLGFWENGFRNFTNSKVAAKVPEDVKSMKIRTMQNDVHMATWKALGVNPTPIAFTELFTAMQQGTVDGEENPLGIVDGNKFQEVQKYLTLTQHVYTPYVLCGNPAKFKSLSKEHQDVILKVAKASVEFQRKRSQDLEKEIVVKVTKEGMQVINLTPEQKAQWQKKVVDAKIFDLVKSKMQHPEYLDAMLKK
jgi:tripartite ATP-independent transporter DctP family solute receptor